ncbi:MAG TPA: cytochrome c oxidase subunit 3 [Burkholderiaceae bacterium]|nr:cytochrome c oxidase subunit 3 [Burkholderiaceae bacterium]HPE02397.1 cytochrome c oxidase subunit 3 [Burkholderiaceae bacterium]HRZ00325.1 cytochrome c oxidase subunit 3 [Burkholderiaceae bacterium]
MGAASAGADARYFIPQPSQWPMVGMLAMGFTGFGAAAVVNSMQVGWLGLLIGLSLLLYMMVGWFGMVALESEGKLYGKQVDVSFRWGMAWFIFSEVMFFAAFFGALFYARVITAPLLGDFDHRLLWPDFDGAWPHSGPAGLVDAFTTIGPFWLPTINTALLLTSGITLTIAHHALLANQRQTTIFWLFITVALGVTFLGVQIYEYVHAYSALNLRLSSGIFGSTFFMLTGFHGFHVFLGAIMLSVILVRLMKGHFSAQHHFGFEAAAWYWHFVDVVWIGLYVVVYWL